jgi:hypothetical protein
MLVYTHHFLLLRYGDRLFSIGFRGGLFHVWVGLSLLKTGLSRFYVAVVYFCQAFISSNQASIFF